MHCGKQLVMEEQPLQLKIIMDTAMLGAASQDTEESKLETSQQNS